MASKKQVEANRQNALKSSGPKTPEGKATARLNATKHGFLSQEVLLPGEDEEALKELAEPLRAELKPVGELESLLVERIVAAYGRMQRLERLEAGIFAFELYGELTKRAEQEAEPYTRTETADDEFLAQFSITIITDKEKHREAMDKVRELESIRDAETATLEQSFIRDAKGANAFSKLSRYQTAIERSLYRALHELQRFQATRRAEGNVSPPVALDVDVTGVPE